MLRTLARSRWRASRASAPDITPEHCWHMYTVPFVPTQIGTQSTPVALQLRSTQRQHYHLRWHIAKALRSVVVHGPVRNSRVAAVSVHNSGLTLQTPLQITDALSWLSPQAVVLFSIACVAIKPEMSAHRGKQG
jgi:hypothetical protein